MTQVVLIPYTTFVYSDFSQQTFAKHTTRSGGEGDLCPRKFAQAQSSLDEFFFLEDYSLRSWSSSRRLKMKIKNIFASQIWIYAPSKIRSSSEQLGRIFSPKRLRASLVIPWVEAKDENQNIFASQIWFYAPAKIRSSSEQLGRIFTTMDYSLRSWERYRLVIRFACDP